MRRIAAWMFMFMYMFVWVAMAGCSKTERGHDSTTTTAPSAIAFPDSWPYPIADTGVTAAHGMVATDAPIATHVGATVLRNGGNAVDAAIATAFALAVVLPAAGNLGGGGFLVVHMGDGREAALDFRERAPGAATRDMYIGANGHADDRSITGPLAAGVPGSVAGLWEAHERFGSRPWAELVAPAIALAEQGFVVDSDFAGAIRGDSARLAHFPASAALFLPHGRVPRAGDRWRDPELAAVLRRISASGQKGFYTGRTAELIAAEMRRVHGIMTEKDLAAYKAKWRDPIEFTYRGHKVISMPPPSSGGLTLALVAHELARFDVRAAPWHSPREINLFAEAMRRGFAVRNGLLGDPDFVTIPMARLLSQQYADSLSKSIEEGHATPSASIHVGGGATAEKKQTTHFSVMDGQGGAAALTTTLNGGFGSAVVVPGTGLLLNDEMDDFAAEPGRPNMFGLVQGEANAIAPGKRMLSSMTPTIVLGDDGKPMLVTGAQGGPTIITTTYQIMSNVIDYDMNIGTAVSAPRVHHQHLPDSLYYERGGLTKATLDSLTAMGYATSPQSPTGDLGYAASILRRNGVVHGASDPRVHGSAEGY
ncbi:MAG TPA: gamma-glutamyltransferase [Gemmatimonadaceae bacterium]|nr:gamma-glutamyltransferase [Gemmatimonadaceae bacterium]